MFDVPPEIAMSPVMEPPAGVQAVLSTKSPEQVWYFITVPIFLVVSAIFVAIRGYTKLRIVRKFDWADYMIGASFIFFIIMVCMARIQLSWGIGAHIWNLRYYDYMRMLFWLNIGEVLYCPTVFFIKTAIVLQYLEILCPNRTLNRFVFYGGWTIIITMGLFYFIDIFLTLFICTPREKIWNDLADGHCMDYNALVVANAIFNIVSDLATMLLPLKSVLQLKITSGKKLWILALFGTGLLATVASAMRIPYMMKLNDQGDKQDASFEMAWMGLWCWAEVTLGIICACSISLPKLWRERRKEMGNVLSRINKPFSAFMSMTRGESSKARSSKASQTSDETGPYKGSPDPELGPNSWPTQMADAGNLLSSQPGSRV